MMLRFALRIGVAAAATCLAVTVAVAQPPANPLPSAPPPAAATPETKPTDAPQLDPMGQEMALKAKPMIYVKGTGTWDKAYDTITAAMKKLKTYADKEGLTADGSVMTIFTATDDLGFQFNAAMPLAAPPKTPPSGDVFAGQTPEGRALKFVHRGSYDAMDNTYEAITNYLDDRKLEAKDLFVEQYVTDPLTTKEDDLVVNILVLVK
jgi:effector-binding domain-containing protein